VRLLSIDLSTVSTGWAFFENEELKASGTIKATDKNTIKRLEFIYSGMGELFTEYRPDVVVVEKALSLQNGDTTIKLAKLHGLLLSLCIKNNLALEEIDNMTWKSHFFKGNPNKVSKEQYYMYVRNILWSGVETDDEAAAILIGTAYLGTQRVYYRIPQYLKK
jgi:crossover junction endodeoxyribonuclease RuvC